MSKEATPPSQDNIDKSVKPETLAFLLAEFDHLGQFWRHTDSRIESSINYYLTTSAVLVSGSILLYQSVSNIILFVAGMIPLGLTFLLLGIFLALRVKSTRSLKEKYAHGLNLIRRRFVDCDPRLADYLVLPISNLPHELQTTTQEPHRETLLRFLFILYGINSLTFGGVIAAILWLTTVLELSTILLISLGVGVASIVITTRSEWRTARMSIQMK